MCKREIIKLIIDQHQGREKNYGAILRGVLEWKCLWGITLEYRCKPIAIVNLRFKKNKAAAFVLPLHFLTSTACGGSISQMLEPEGKTKMEECNLLAKPRPPLELWTLYFIQYCQLVPVAPDHHHPSLQAHYSTEAMSLQVGRLRPALIWQVLLIGQQGEVGTVPSQKLMAMSLSSMI